MKKLVSLALCLVIALGMVTFAAAATVFKYSGDQVTNMESWSTPATSSGKRWHLTWKSSNLSQSNRAVVRIMAEDGTRASALWVYSSKSTLYHDYYASSAYGKKKTYITGRSDDDTAGFIKVEGWFHN